MRDGAPVSGCERVSNRVMNLGDLLTQTARRLVDQPGIIQAEQSVGWRQLNERVDAAAHALATLGVGHGDKVLVQSKNSIAMFETLFAVFKLGAVWVPINFRVHPSDITHLASHSEARLMIYEQPFAEHADVATSAGVETLVCIGTPRDGEYSYTELRRAQMGKTFQAAEVDRDDPCWFFYTSGTTGKPKAAVLSHGQMAFVVNNHLADLMPGMREPEASLVVAPLSHGAGLHQLVQVARGIRTVLTATEKLVPREVFELIEKHRVSNLFTVPTILQALVSDPAVDRADHSSLRYVIYAGAPMLRDHQRHALQKLGLCLVQYFGLGEVTGNITVLPPHLHSVDDEKIKPGTCGYARTGMQIDILDDNGRSLPPSEIGEICVIGPAVFNGYYHNDQANRQSFRNGWFRTGDLGYMDDEGFLYITGRASDMFISGGSNIYPLEVEEKIAAHPAVSEVCVLGMPDSKWGEIGVAALVLKPGKALDYDELKQWLQQRMASYKIPKQLVLFDSLPRSGYGKITKNLVRQALLQRQMTPQQATRAGR